MNEITALVFDVLQAALNFPQANPPTAKTPEWYDQWASKNAHEYLKNALYYLEQSAEMVVYNNQMNQNNTIDILEI